MNTSSSLNLNDQQSAFYDRVVAKDFSKILLTGEAGTGKAQSLTSKVLTPSGWALMGDLEVGDEVLTPNGKTSKILGVFPQGNKDIYEISFHDGSKARACEEHLWEVKVPPQTWQRSTSGTVQIVDTKFIKDFLDQKQVNGSNRNLSIRLINRIKTPNIDLPIDPYVLGCILGDGGISHNTVAITTSDQEIVDRINAAIQPDYILKKYKGDYSYGLVCSSRCAKHEIKRSIKDLGLMGKRSWEKEIPSLYMNCGTEQKLELLRGLFDTDGTASSKCSVSFSSSSKKLAEQVQELVWSLGGVARVTIKQSSYTYKGEKLEGRLSYRVWVRTPTPKEFFTLDRKLSRCPDVTDVAQFNRRIKSVELVSNEPAQCIMIDDPSHLYITDDYVVTHNTFTLTMAMADLYRRGANVVIVAPTHLARLNLIEKLPEDIRHRVPTMTVASLLKRFGFDRGDGTTQFTAPSGERLKDFDVIAIDEVSMIGQKDYDVLKISETKIIFSGDFAQLPAVMAKSAKDDILGGEEKPEHFHFTKQMRQVGVIHQVAERNRDEVFFPDKTLVGDSGESVIVHDSREGLMETMATQILSNCQTITQTTDYRYICHTNDGVSEANDYIRSKVVAHFLQGSPNDHFVVGETLMMYENTPVAYNGEVVEVIDVWADARYAYINSYPWEAYKIIIRSKSGTDREIKVIPPRHRPLFKKFLAQLQSDLYRARIHAHHTEADEIYEEIKYITSYWTNVNYPYAVTCHKSQGMTIPNVFLDTLSFAKAPGKRSLLYVGLSRASLNLHTVKVIKPEAEVKREINVLYRETRMAYEAITGQSYLELKKRTGLPTRTAQDKQVFTEYLAAVIADLEQEGDVV